MPAPAVLEEVGDPLARNWPSERWAATSSVSPERSTRMQGASAERLHFDHCTFLGTPLSLIQLLGHSQGLAPAL